MFSGRRSSLRLLLVVGLAGTIGGCSTSGPQLQLLPPPPPPPIAMPAPLSPPKPKSYTVIASRYASRLDGLSTATGDVYDEDLMTAAARDFPLGSRVAVTNLENGRSVEVVVNDCGPFIRGRRIDLSRHAAERIGLGATGITRVKVILLKRGAKGRMCPAHHARAAHHAPAE